MPSEDHRNGEVPKQEHAVEEYSFDKLAKGVANGTLSRGRALKLVGAAILGGAFTSLLPGVAEARRRHHKCPPCPTPSACPFGGSCSANPISCQGTINHPHCSCLLQDENGLAVCVDTVSIPAPKECSKNADCATGQVCACTNCLPLCNS